jgi:Kef-type K+ transport system membrane component KefB
MLPAVSVTPVVRGGLAAMPSTYSSERCLAFDNLLIVVALGLKATGLVETPLLIAIILCATSLGVLIPVLKDAGEISSTFGQLIVAAGTIADFGAVILLSIFFSGEGGVGATLLLIGSLVLLFPVIGLGLLKGGEGKPKKPDEESDVLMAM